MHWAQLPLRTGALSASVENRLKGNTDVQAFCKVLREVQRFLTLHRQIVNVDASADRCCVLPSVRLAQLVCFMIVGSGCLCAHYG